MAYEYDPSSIQASRKVFGFALSHDPFELYDTLNKPRPSALADSVYVRIRHDYLQRDSVAQQATSAEEKAFGLLQRSVDQVDTLMQPYLREKTAQEGREFITGKTAREWLATLALRRDDDEMTGFANLVDFRHRNYRLVTDADHPGDRHPKTIPPHKERGCPFAGHDGEVHIDPIFRRFVPWAGALALAAVETHGLRSL